MPYHLSVATPDEPSGIQRSWGFNLDVHDLVNVWMDPPENSVPFHIDRGIQNRLILSEAMYQNAVTAEEQYPNKRLLIHIGPPHDLYLGSTGEKLHEKADRPWHAHLNGEINVDVGTLRKAYRENVDLAVATTKQLAENLSGRTVISADHGDLLWERSSPIPTKEYRHPEQTYVEELVRVPWNGSENGMRTIHSDPPTDYRERHTSEDDAKEQLRALGYME